MEHETFQSPEADESAPSGQVPGTPRTSIPGNHHPPSASETSGGPPARRSSRRRPRKKPRATQATEAAPSAAGPPDPPDEESLLPETEDAGEAAPVLPAESLLLPPPEQEALEAGEPIPLYRRQAAPPGPAELAGEVLVPEAVDEPLPSLFFDPSREGGVPADLTLQAPLPPITPELLAEVRGVSPEEELVEEAAALEARSLDEAPLSPLQAVPPLPPPPSLVLVPEALPELAPEEALPEEAPARLVAEPEARVRKRRRRGRERRKEKEAPVVPTVPLAVREEAPAAPARERERREEREFKELLINVDDRETRIALLEGGRLMELHVEREERVVGNIFKGRVANVLPGMDAAFVDIGLERNAFLYVGDILFEDPSRTGNGDVPIRRTSRDVRIRDVARPGQEILVQVVKGPRGTKGARVSTKISIPGRYLVLMPDADHLGVSRKIEDAHERERLRRIAEQLQPRGFGMIVRTEAEGRTEAELRADLEYLVNTWNAIQEKARKAHAPALIHKDLGLILKTIRDLFGSDVDKLIIDSREEYEKIVETLRELAPDLVDRVHLHEDPEPLFTRYNIEEEIDRLLRRKVWLRNGAYLLIDTTEALTTIDVNTGKFVGSTSLAETILKTNLDAVEEIARQLRLRDIGGMIVLDFIDMASSRDRQMVMRALENAFRKDRTRTKIAHISPLGLVEMTRKRTAESITDVMSQACPYCQGRGRVWSPETVAIQIEREMRRLCARQEVDAFLVYANPEVAAWLIGPEGESVEQMERALRRPIYIRAREDFHIEKFEIIPSDMMELERQLLPFHGGHVVECKVTRMDLITPPRSAAWADGYFIDLANGIRYQGQTTRVRLTDVRRSFALGEPVAPPTAVDRSEPI